MSHVTLHTTIVNYLGVEVNTLFEHLIEKITVNRSDIVSHIVRLVKFSHTFTWSRDTSYMSILIFFL